MSSNTAYQIPVLGKAISILHAVAASPGEITSAGLARSLGIAPATSYRIIQTFVKARWLRLAADGRCELGLGLLPIALGLRQHDLLRQQVVDTLNELTEKTGLTSKVSAREGDEAVTLMRVNSNQSMALAVKEGAGFHLALGSSGAVFLSQMTEEEVARILKSAPAICWQYQTSDDVRGRLAEARRERLAADLGGFRPDIFGLSVPLLDQDGHVQGALTLTGLMHGITEKQTKTWRNLLIEKADELNYGREMNS